MKLKIVIALLLAAAGVVAFFGYDILRDRYFPNNQEIMPAIKENIQSSEEDTDNNQSANPDSEDEEKRTTPIDVPDDSDIPEEDKIDQETTGDEWVDKCDTECTGLKDEELEYCRQVCGLAETANPDNCDDLSGLKKDYCFKDKAIKDKDYSICEKIKDNEIKTTCTSRITEDFLDQNYNPE